MRILLAEDDRRLGNLTQHLLAAEKFQVDWVVQGDQAYDYAIFSPYDVIILDWLLPGESGLSVCRRLREHQYQGAILMLTARDTLEDKILGLNTGADDYLVKPFEFAELLARIQALSRRSPLPFTAKTVALGNFILDRTNRVLKQGNREITLTGREFQMLDLLVQNRGQIVPRQVILDRVWGLESEVTPNTLDAYVSLLRKKLNPYTTKPLIHNVRGIGYKLED